MMNTNVEVNDYDHIEMANINDSKNNKSQIIKTDENSIISTVTETNQTDQTDKKSQVVKTDKNSIISIITETDAEHTNSVLFLNFFTIPEKIPTNGELIEKLNGFFKNSNNEFYKDFFVILLFILFSYFEFLKIQNLMYFMMLNNILTSAKYLFNFSDVDKSLFKQKEELYLITQSWIVYGTLVLLFDTIDYCSNCLQNKLLYYMLQLVKQNIYYKAITDKTFSFKITESIIDICITNNVIFEYVEKVCALSVGTFFVSKNNLSTKMKDYFKSLSDDN